MATIIKFPIKNANPYNVTAGPLYASYNNTDIHQYLPMLTEAVINLIHGRCVVLFSRSEKFEIGERVFLKETFAETFLGDFDCTQADYLLSGGRIQNKPWQYSNRMPQEYCRRVVVVEDVFRIYEEEMYATFPEINTYNRQKWYFAGTESLSRFWFREKILPALGKKNAKKIYYAYCFRLEKT